MIENNELALKDVLKLVRTAAQPLVSPDYKPFVIVPDGFHVFDMVPRPLADYVKATLELDTPRAFIDYVNAYKTETTVCFATIAEKAADFEAIIDYHRPGKPARAAHRVLFTPKFSAAHLAWLDLAMGARTQEYFIEFLMNWGWTCESLEDADILELISNLEFKSVNNLATKRNLNGTVSLSYTEDVEGRAGGKRIEVPDSLLLFLPIFEGSSEIQLAVRIIYRIERNMLSLKFIIPHHQEIIRRELDNIIKAVAEETSVPVLPGQYKG